MYLLIWMHMAHGVFEYDRAIEAAQRGDWHKASRILYDVYDSPQVLYDKGVIAYKQGDYTSALDYFLQAATDKTATQKEKELSYFNSGTVAIALDNKKAAIEYLEKSLTLNPENTFAQHNLQKLKEQQHKEEEQKEKDKDKDKQSEDQKNKDEQSPQDSSDNKEKKEEKNNKNEESSSKNQQPSEKKPAESQNKKNNANDTNNGKQKNTPQEEEEEKNGRPEQQKKEDTAQEQTSGDEQKQQQQKNPSTGKGAQKKQLENNKKNSGNQEGWVAQLLSECEKRDAQASKEMMKGMVARETTGHDGQNCW